MPLDDSAYRVPDNALAGVNVWMLREIARLGNFTVEFYGACSNERSPPCALRPARAVPAAAAPALGAVPSDAPFPGRLRFFPPTQWSG